eukprot:3500300-Pyramimonas_sp.AAC.1
MGIEWFVQGSARPGETRVSPCGRGNRANADATNNGRGTGPWHGDAAHLSRRRVAAKIRFAADIL